MEQKNGKIVIDGDACPKSVKNIVIEVAQEYNRDLLMVASFNHNLEGPFRKIVVGNEPQAVDLAVSNLTKKGDIVVTQDWGLAAVILGKGGRAISPLGMIYNMDKIEFLLEQRHLKAKIRRSGGRTKGPSSRTKKDDQNFRRALRSLLGEKSKGHAQDE